MAYDKHDEIELYKKAILINEGRLLIAEAYFKKIGHDKVKEHQAKEYEGIIERLGLLKRIVASFEATE